MSWQDIIKDSKAANEALEMDFFMNNLEKALEYETQDIRFADFGNKQKVLDISEKGTYNLRIQMGIIPLRLLLLLMLKQPLKFQEEK